MARKKTTEPRFTAMVEVKGAFEVEFAAANWEEALAKAKALKWQEITKGYVNDIEYTDLLMVSKA